MAEHKFTSEATKGLGVNKLLEMVLHDTFTTSLNKRLMKLMVNTPHNDLLGNDIQYPRRLMCHNGNSPVACPPRVVAIVLPVKVCQ